jgi:hypothetical protein
MSNRCPSNPILYLLQRKYGGAVETFLGSLPEDEQQERWQAEVEAYRVELQGLDDEHFEMLVYQELEKEAHERQLHEEQARFFHQPNAVAAFKYWGRFPLWTLEEAIALTLGKNPVVVTWAEIESYVEVSPFAEHFCNLRRFILRAREAGQLADPVPPKAYVDWAKAKGIALPTGLKESVNAKQGDEDWKTLYEEAKVQLDAMTSELDRLEAADEPLSGKERKTFLKLILGTAIGGYGYDYRATKSSTAQETPRIYEPTAYLLIRIRCARSLKRRWLNSGSSWSALKTSPRNRIRSL